MTMKTAAHLIAEAKARIENLSPAAVAVELESDDVLLVDLREAEERQSSIPGAVHAPRGMLEFYADPTSAYYRSEFDPGRRTILYCASGGRSALMSTSRVGSAAPTRTARRSSARARPASSSGASARRSVPPLAAPPACAPVPDGRDGALVPPTVHSTAVTHPEEGRWIR